MEQENTKRSRIIGLRLTTGEYDGLEKEWKKSNCRKLSDYVRRLIFGKPLVSSYRNRSMDELMAELIVLRKELNAIGNNFNQAVHRLHTLDHLPQMQHWLVGFERDKHLLSDQMEAIKIVIKKMGGQWLQ
ncbi:plasmid mobilization relaxosome protein MobC [Mucilaginibacter litoreus]|uniref:Plasmid mobilization relaxosome protein MobC n=1 Tax=Mucilaginibacter litoreus TaxID=1048221 RepID=A0ABW3AX19_9SPHI